MAANLVGTPQATSADADQPREEWIPVAVESLEFADQSFDLYIRDQAGKSSFRLYCGRKPLIISGDEA